jgi:hypothetical protein
LADANINTSLRQDIVQVGDIGLQSLMDQDVSTIQLLLMQAEKMLSAQNCVCAEHRGVPLWFQWVLVGIVSPRPHQPIAATRRLIEKISGDLIHAAVDCKVGRSEELYGG